MEKRDEEQILAELQGVYLEKFVYSFKQGGQEIVGISWAGIKEIAYRIGEIETSIEKYEETDESYVFIVKATNKGVGSRLGVSNQPKNYANGKPDTFALQKALSKAQRNAIRGVIPEATIEQYLKTFMQQSRHVDAKPEPRKNVQATQNPKQEKQWDPDEQTVITTLEVNNLDPSAVMVYKYGGVMKVQPSPTFKAEEFEAYDKVLRLMKDKWVKEASVWEVVIQ